MCGRYKLTTPTGVIIEDLGIQVGRPNLEARYNIAPTQAAPIVRNTEAGRELAMLRWGLIPSWAKDAKIAFSTINARAETVADKPAFKDALKSRRALILADGFYEWKTEAGGKQPYLFARKDGGVMAFAGLWERWGTGAEVIESFTIIVTSANDLIRDVHDRMPVILEPQHFEAWLACEQYAPKDVLPLLTSFDAAQMSMEPVSRVINNVKNEGPAVLAGPAQTSLLL